MKLVLGTLGALVGGVIGAVIWGVIVHFTGYELGLVAWGIGGLVGFGAAVVGGRGVAMGTVCALVAILAIAGGKLLFIHFLVQNVIEDTEQNVLTVEVYEEIKAEAEAYALVTSDSQFREFLVKWEGTDATRAEDVTQEDIEVYSEYRIPVLKEYLETRPEYGEWKKIALKSELGDFSYGEAFKSTIGLMDLLFAALGIGTAFKLGAGAEALAEVE